MAFIVIYHVKCIQPSIYHPSCCFFFQKPWGFVDQTRKLYNWSTYWPLLWGSVYRDESVPIVAPSRWRFLQHPLEVIYPILCHRTFFQIFMNFYAIKLKKKKSYLDFSNYCNIELQFLPHVYKNDVVVGGAALIFI